MVTFIPPYMGEEIKSNAERKMYDVLQEMDLKNAYVLHSLGLPRHRSKIYGEIDFVVVARGALPVWRLRAVVWNAGMVSGRLLTGMGRSGRSRRDRLRR